MTPLLSVRDLRVEFRRRDQPAFVAVAGVSFDIQEGEVFGLVGETGCGKTVTALSVLQVLPPTAAIRGRVQLQGRDLVGLPERELERIRGRQVGVVFQDPTSAFNPVFTIGGQMDDVVRRHLDLRSRERRELIVAGLASVGLPDADRVAKSYPHELSGGMLQRAMIAMALICEPALLIADEPTTALDVTIAAGVVRLLRRLQAERKFSILFITHNLGLVSAICDRVAVLYAGHVAEVAETRALFRAPQHPYTRGLLGALPEVSTRGHSLVPIPGTVPSNPGEVVGCPFAERCGYVMARCRVEMPGAYEVGADHYMRCFLGDAATVRAS